MKTSVKKVLKASGIAAVTVGAAAYTSYLTTKFLMKVAMDRDEPKVMQYAEKKFAGTTAVNADFLKTIDESAEKLAQKEHTVVEITAADGVKLVGHWFPHPHPQRIVIGMHGWRSSWCRDFGMIADFWTANGCSVLLAEQRGQGNSGGEYMGFGQTECHDCLEWIQWASRQYDEELPVYLGGVSMGATTVLMAAGLDLPECVHGIVADCGFTTPYAIWKHVANKNLHLSFGLRGPVADRLYRSRLQIGSEDYSTVEALRRTKVPVLLVHGEDDHFVPVEMTYENYEACASPKRMLIIPGADHGMSYYLAKDAYEEAVRNFWRDFDKQ